jgi:tetratricopeptide (TPR) repeat protein
VLEAEANSLINLGADLAATGKGEQGVEAFEQVEEIFERDSWFRWRYNVRLQASAGEYWLGRGKLDRASRHATLLLELATRYSARKYVATAHKLLAEVAAAHGDREAALASVEAALEVQRDYPAPLLDWRLYGALGRLRAARGEAEGARAAFERAVEIAMAIASNVGDDRLRETFLTSPPVREICAGALGS